MANKQTLTGEDEDNKQEELVIVETEQPEQKLVQAEAADDHDDDDDDDDRRLKREEGDHGDEDRDAVRERRRKEKAERKQRREEAIRRNNVEMEFLRKRNDELEQRLNGLETNAVQQRAHTVDEALAKATREMKLAEQVISKAISANNGEDAAQAIRYRDQAAQRVQQLAYAKQQLNEQAQQPQQREAPQQQMPPREVLLQAKKFVAENDWYDPSGGNEDSAIMLAIDAQMVREGFDPKTEEYWEELRARGRRRLPERFGSRNAEGRNAEQRTPRGGPQLGSGRESVPASTRKEVYISPERKQALIDAGVWDDPVLRARYVKQYAKYDANKRG